MFRLDVALREKTYWRLLYESAARADEVLTLDVGDLDVRNKQARVVAKGGGCGVDPLAVGNRPAATPADPRSPGGADLPDRPPGAGRGRRPWTCARSRAEPGSPTGGRRSCSPRQPAPWTRPARGGPCTSSATPTSRTRPRTAPARPCCWPAPGTPRSARWSAMRARVWTRSGRTSLAGIRQRGDVTRGRDRVSELTGLPRCRLRLIRSLRRWAPGTLTRCSRPRAAGPCRFRLPGSRP